MLAELNISNFAIIDKLYLRLGAGFNALTGETGAGKSIIIDALGALLGSKIGPEFVRHGSQSARVEGQFDLSTMQEVPRDTLRALLLDGGLSDTDDGSDETVIISREINATGRTVARINGRMVNLPTLQQVGELLVDIHGQSEHVSLLRSATHIDLLDEYAGLAPQRKQMADLVSQLRAVQRELRDLQRDERELARRADLLTFQVEEIDKAALQPGEDEDLANERSRLANSERLSSLCDSIYALLIESGDEGEFGGRAARGGKAASGQSVRDAVADASGMLAELARLDPSMAEHEAALAALYDGVEEMGRTMRAYRETVEHDPSRLEEIEERISLIHELKRKYGGSIDEIIAFGQRAADELDTLTHSEERIARLQEESDRLAREIGVLGAEMSSVRAEAGEQLAQAVEIAMKDLLMGSSRFKVEIVQVEAADGVPLPRREGRFAYSDKGVDRVEFLISANPGEPLKPLAKIASGGETSRLMLALKSILSEADLTSTLVFDEVDVGVGGRSGGVVGEKLWALTSSHQVLCITHLPQIAAFGDDHFKITKHVKDDRTITRVDRLEADEQEQEIAAMIGGAPVSAAALENAREMLRDTARAKGQKEAVSA
jgi:DNA repair protein RecN (Recombination protein N)